MTNTKEPKYVGILEDNRPEYERAKDFKHEELFGTPVVQWLTNKEASKSIDLFPVRDQKSTFACVCYSAVTALYNSEDEILSPAFLYTQRFNKPGEGCYYFDIGDIVVKQGVAKESLLKSPLTEKEINAVKITDSLKKDAQSFRQKSYVFIDDPSIDQIAELLNKGIAVMISVFGTSKEWSSEYPTMIDSNLDPLNATINHAITALPRSAYKQGGIKYFKIQDSAHFGNIVFRDLSESWVKKRVKHAMYFVDLDKAPIDFPQELRSYTWNNDLTVGSRGEAVIALQKFLRYKGFFPTILDGELLDFTGYFGGVTKKAVSDYQKSKGIKPDVGYFGTLTRTEANKETF